MRGDPIKVRIENGRWLDGQIEVEADGKVLVISVVEGVSAPFTLYSGRQLLQILWTADGAKEVQANRHVELRRPGESSL